jgi:hypothetical protein
LTDIRAGLSILGEEPHMIWLAQSENAGEIFVWVVVLVIGLIALAAATLWVRSWIYRPEEPVGGGFSLGELAALRKKGEITEEEYQRARGRLVAMLKADLNVPPQKTDEKG